MADALLDHLHGVVFGINLDVISYHQEFRSVSGEDDGGLSMALKCKMTPDIGGRCTVGDSREDMSPLLFDIDAKCLSRNSPSNEQVSHLKYSQHANGAGAVPSIITGNVYFAEDILRHFSLALISATPVGIHLQLTVESSSHVEAQVGSPQLWSGFNWDGAPLIIRVAKLLFVPK